MKNVTVLFPGGFKPITGAHMALAQRYAQNPNVDKVIMLIGPKERDGITRDTSIKMFNLLNKNTNIEIQPTNFNSPIMAAYEYLFELPEDTQGRFALAASEKDDDYVRVKSFLYINRFFIYFISSFFCCFVCFRSFFGRRTSTFSFCTNIGP